jgi:hypothetical protein
MNVKASSVNLQGLQQGDNARSALSSSPSPRPPGSAATGLDEGYFRLSYVKSVESVDPYDLDIEVGN